MYEIHANEPGLAELKKMQSELFLQESTDENIKKLKAIESQIARHESNKAEVEAAAKAKKDAEEAARKKEEEDAKKAEERRNSRQFERAHHNVGRDYRHGKK